ncbi:MAG: hypothetical protein ABIK52_05805 [Bacteroidota bacterium]
MEMITPTGWTDYELLDTGGREKLERFGDYLLIRPEPQAVWQKALSEKEWDLLSHARFRKVKSSSPQSSVHSHRSTSIIYRTSRIAHPVS